MTIQGWFHRHYETKHKQEIIEYEIVLECTHIQSEWSVKILRLKNLTIILVGRFHRFHRNG